MFSRVWAMPNHQTFLIPPIRDMVHRLLSRSPVSVDPYAGNSSLATLTNDLNPKTSATYHMDAVDFLNALARKNVIADLILYDPPYSPRQIARCYAGFGRKATRSDTQNSRSAKRFRQAVSQVAVLGSYAACFGWNTCGLGQGWITEEIMLVCHGASHNDTICTVQRRMS